MSDNDLLNKPTNDTKREVKPPWFNWWRMPLPIFGISFIVLAIDKVQGPTPYPSRDTAETAAADLIAQHDATGCNCGFGKHLYIGAYEAGKTPQ